jgi:tRNA pseudouridine65 synthase
VSTFNFPLLFSDPHYVAINKPPGILMHRTRISEDTVFLVQVLRDQLGHKVYPVHRLDRATSGALILGKTAEAAGRLGEQVMDKTVEKKYIAIVRGWAPESGTIDYALDDPETGKGKLDAVTHFSRLGCSEIDEPIGLRYKTARFSLVEAQLETGRRHQIRKHFAHLNHPVIGDKRHGDVKQNTYFREVFGLQRMFLHSIRLGFRHPFTDEPTTITAPVDEEFAQTLKRLQLYEFYRPLCPDDTCSAPEAPPT